MKPSKMMIETWRWKDEIYRETKHMTREQLLDHYRQLRGQFEKEGFRFETDPPGPQTRNK